MAKSQHPLPEGLLKRAKARLRAVFGNRFQGLILYGSEARRDAVEDSDVDLLVLLLGPMDEGEDSWTCIRALYPLVLELERPIHAKPTDILAYQAQEIPLYRNVHEEGIPV